MRKGLVNGFGINDATYAVNKTVDGKSVRCPIYSAWKDMIRRVSLGCHTSIPENLKTYERCTVDSEWISFMNFHKWTTDRDWEGMQLDKDILVIGNKEYGPSTCILVPHYINNIFRPSNKKSDLPRGVRKKHLKYEAFSKVSGNSFYLGLYETVEEAHIAWQYFKIQSLKEAYSKLKNDEFRDCRIFPAINRLISTIAQDISQAKGNNRIVNIYIYIYKPLKGLNLLKIPTVFSFNKRTYLLRHTEYPYAIPMAMYDNCCASGTTSKVL